MKLIIVLQPEFKCIHAVHNTLIKLNKQKIALGWFWNEFSSAKKQNLFFCEEGLFLGREKIPLPYPP